MNSITQNHQDEELLSKKMQVVSHTLLSTENTKNPSLCALSLSAIATIGRTGWYW